MAADKLKRDPINKPVLGREARKVRSEHEADTHAARIRDYGSEDAATYQQLQKVQPVTRNLIEAVMLDAWPHNAAIVDFGIDSQKHYESLYYPIRNQEISPVVLDAAMGHGEKLTELVRGAPGNPHKDIVFHTSWDSLLGREKPEFASRHEAIGNPQSDYQKALDAAADRGSSHAKGKEGLER